MARISDRVIEQIKADVPLADLLRRQGYALKAHGKDEVTHCPFHNDRTPSLVISPDSNLWNCLGACGEGGSVIDWVMKTEGVSFRLAIEMLRGDLSAFSRSVTERGKRPIKRTSKPKLDGAIVAGTDDGALLDRVVSFYHRTLLESPEALDYLKQRGLGDPDLIKTFRLGYANRTLGYRLPRRNRKAGLEIRSQLQTIGVLRSSGHEHFTGCVAIPIIDERGQVRSLYGRRISYPNRKASLHLYLPGPHQGVFNAGNLKDQGEVILCESLIDALTFYQAGFKVVTTAYGTSGVTEELLTTLQAFGAERVLIAFDRDAAGNKGAESVAKKLAKLGIDSYRIEFPKGMDANEYALKVAPADKSLGLVVRKALFLQKGLAKPAGSPAEPKPELPTEPETLPSLAAEPASESPSKPEPLPTPQAPESVPLINGPTGQADPSSEPVTPSPVPRAAREIKPSVNDKEIVLEFGDRLYRIRGLDKNLSEEQMKVIVLAGRGDELHVDTLDLYQAKARSAFVRQTGIELCADEKIIKRDIGKVLRALEAIQHQRIEGALAPTQAEPTLSPDEEREALELLKSPDLLRRIVDDLSACGLVGEGSNKLVAYLACVSRKLESPLAVMIQSTSAAGKSALMDAVLALVPEGDRVHYSAMTGQSLYYMNDGDLKHKVLAIAEEQGVQQASYALKLLQSQGELTIASTGKDPNTGKLITEQYRVEGPVMLLLTTTAIEIDEELLNRCLVLTVDEGREQTRRIHEQQRRRRTLAGLKEQHAKDKLRQLHRNAQQLLKPLAVLNPYAEQLTFVDDRTRTRRDHEKYLTLIDAIALLHQHQRPIKTAVWQGETVEYIEVTLEDIEQANALAHEVIGRSLDELPPQTRRLLGDIQSMVAAECARQVIARSDYRFSRKQVREATGMGETQLRHHLRRLVDLEYVLTHRGGRGQSFVYELLFDGDLNTPDPQLIGLIQPDLLHKTNGTNRSSRGSEGQFAGPTRPQSGANAGGSRGGKNGAKPSPTRLNGQSTPEVAENALLRESTGSYRSNNPTPA